MDLSIIEINASNSSKIPSKFIVSGESFKESKYFENYYILSKAAGEFMTT